MEELLFDHVDLRTVLLITQVGLSTCPPSLLTSPAQVCRLIHVTQEGFARWRPRAVKHGYDALLHIAPFKNQ